MNSSRLRRAGAVSFSILAVACEKEAPPPATANRVTAPASATASATGAPVASATPNSPKVAPVVGETVAQGTCEPAGKLTPWRYHLALAETYTGEVLAMGGHQHDSGFELADVDSFDVSTKTWTKAKPMNKARAGHVAIAGADFHLIYAIGGSDKSVEVFEAPNEGRRWTTIGQLDGVADGAVSFKTADGRILVAGGDLLWKGAVSNSVFSIKGFTVTKEGTLPEPLFGAIAVQERAKGLTTLVGGHSTDGAERAHVLVYDENKKSWSTASASSFEYLKKLPPGVTKASGVIFVSPTMFVAERVIYTYDAKTSAWTSRAKLERKHAGGASIALAGGKVLFVGGINESDAAAELCTIP